MKQLYIQSAAQISAQHPLCDAWVEQPILHERIYVRSLDPDFKEYLPANTTRRMSRILKRAIVTSREAMRLAGATDVDAIITGTGLGCVESTTAFMDKMVREGESLLNPSFFMQSTHNMISAMVAIDFGCHGYNNTYIHKRISFDSALYDGFLQLQEGKIGSALIGGHDEMTPDAYLMLSRLGFWRYGEGEDSLRRGEETFAGETAVSLLLSDQRGDNPLCALAGVKMLYRPTKEEMVETLSAWLDAADTSLDEVDGVVVGLSGDAARDASDYSSIRQLFPGKPLVYYKGLFGDSFTSSAMAMYVAATCLSRGEVPASCCYGTAKERLPAKKLLLYNGSEDKNYTFTLLKSC